MVLWVEQWLLRRIKVPLFGNPLVVHFIFVPNFLQPADCVSRLEALCEGSRSTALEAARDPWRRLGSNVSCALYIGSVVELPAFSHRERFIGPLITGADLRGHGRPHLVHRVYSTNRVRAPVGVSLVEKCLTRIPSSGQSTPTVHTF